MLHSQLIFGNYRLKRHLLKMMYTLTTRRSDILVVRDRERVLLSDKYIHLEERRVSSEIYGKSF